MYYGGVTYASFIVGVIFVFLIGRWLVSMVRSFVKDAEYKRPWPFCIPEYEDPIMDLVVILCIIGISLCAVFGWPLTIIVAVVAAGLHSARFAVRTGKKLGSLKEKSHEHPESVEQSQSKFSW